MSASDPGIRRRRAGDSFVYVNSKGRPIRDAQTLDRIKRLAIPPAWEDVWICAAADGHLQATGRDSRGRKQYRYHARWREVRDEAKYNRLLEFAATLPRIRRRVARDLKLHGLPRRKVLATIIRLLERTQIRVGNEEYMRANKSYGLSTMLDQHVAISGSQIRFRFKGKSGIRHRIEVDDGRLARIVRRCQELPGQQLFQYLDEDENVQDVGSSDVNEYLREISGNDFTAKDFRTWTGTVLAAETLAKVGPFKSKRDSQRKIKAAMEEVACQLGNTVAVCKKCYIHPAVLDAYLQGEISQFERDVERQTKSRSGRLALSAEEQAVVELVKRQLAKTQWPPPGTATTRRAPSRRSGKHARTTARRRA